MNKKRLEYFKRKLIDEKKKIIKTLNNMDNMEEYAQMDNYYNELSHYDNHPADVGTEVFMREQDEGFKINLKDTIQEIQDSLIGINKGNYGTCNVCSKEIDERRLEVIPYAKTCLECTSDVEVKEKIYESLEDEYITSFSYDTKDNNAYDREDAYQDIVQFDMVPGDPSFSTGDYMGVTDEENEFGIDDIENISQEYYDETLK